MYIEDSIKMTLPTGLNEGSGLMDFLDEESIKIMKVMYLISKRHDVHVTIDGDKEKVIVKINVDEDNLQYELDLGDD